MFRTISDMDFQDKKVLIRADIDVPVDDNGVIQDDFRLKKTVPTIKAVLDKGAKQAIIMGHMDRPKGEVVEKLKTDKVAERFSQLLGQDVAKVDDCINIEIPEPEDGKNRIVVLENLRFHKAEKENNEDFAKALAEHADAYVDNAFANSHRKHASVHAITKFLPGCVGLEIQEEIEKITGAINNPEHPFIAIIGGAKLETKIPVIENLLDKVDRILLGGAMIFTFYRSQGFETGKGLVDGAEIKIAKELLEKGGDKLVLPVDVVIAKEAKEGQETKNVAITEIPSDMMGLDIGSETIEFFKNELKDAKTIIWNGPLGMFEIKEFAKGTHEIAKFVAERNAVKVIGGGDTGDVIHDLKLEGKMTHVSVGGGASLTLFSGQELPAVKALEENAEKF